MRKIILFTGFLISCVGLAAQVEKGMWMASGSLFSGTSIFQHQNNYEETNSFLPSVSAGYFAKDWLCYGGDLNYSFSSRNSIFNGRNNFTKSHLVDVSPFLRGYFSTGKIALFSEVKVPIQWNTFVQNDPIRPIYSPWSIELKTSIAANFFLSPNLSIEAGATVLLFDSAVLQSVVTNNNRLSLNIAFRQFLRPNSATQIPDWQLAAAYLQRHNFYFGGSIIQNYSFEGTRNGNFKANIGYFIRNHWQLDLDIGLSNSLFFNPSTSKYVSVSGAFGLRYFAPLIKERLYLAPAVSFFANTINYELLFFNNPRRIGGELAAHQFMGNRWHFSMGGRYQYGWVVGEFATIETSHVASVFLRGEYSILPEWACFFELNNPVYHRFERELFTPYLLQFQSFRIGVQRFIFADLFYE